MEIELKCNVFDLDFHPSTNIVAIGLATGKLSLYDYVDEATPKKLLQVKAHTKTCHALRFVNEGRGILTGSSDCSILSIDVETGSKIARLDHAHGDTINKIVNLTESTIASGDNGGCIKIWDTRQRSCCNTFSIHQDYISDMSFASESMKLIGTSGDGTLSVCNLRSNKVQTQSEFSEDELLSVVIMKNGRKVICGTQSGTLLLYSWGFFKDCSDRFVGLCPNSVNTMLKLDEDRIIIGSENGIISLVGILPNRIIQPIAEHHSIHSVERLAFSHDKKFIGSISEEETLKIWDLDELLLGSKDTMSNNSVATDSDTNGMEVDENVSIPSKGTKTKNGSKGSNLSNASNFFADM